jgi:hypothetical protein
MEFTTVFETLYLSEAQAIRAQLEAAGFEPNIPDEYSAQTMGGGYAGQLSGLRVQVPTPQAEEARKFLDSSTEAS